MMEWPCERHVVRICIHCKEVLGGCRCKNVVPEREVTYPTFMHKCNGRLAESDKAPVSKTEVYPRG